MAPQVFAGKYEVREEIARGGMGVIYKAFDRILQREVAIKLVHTHLSGDPSFAQRFLREARAMARLQHENIVKIHAIEEEHKTQFLVMEFCPGRNLRAMIRQSHLPARETVHISRQLASALACAHAQPIFHRDIKPANVLFDKEGKAKLTDFGIAAALDEAGLTSGGQVLGTPEYMSPEQARGEKIDSRSDLYSLGVVMYEMLTGKTPYSESLGTASSGTAILGKLVYDRGDLTLQFPSHVPPLVQGVVRDLLRRHPDDRISDADTLASQLHEILYTLPQAQPTTAPDKSDPTIVSTTRPTQTEDRLRFTSPNAETVIAPSTRRDYHQKTVFTDAPVIQPDSWKSPQAEDKTTVLPPQPHTASTYKVPQPIFSPPPLTPTGSPIKSLIVGGLLLVAALVGLVSYLGDRPDKPTVDVIPPVPQADTSPPPSSPSEDQKIALLEKQLKDHEHNLSKLETLVRRNVDPLQIGRLETDCTELKTLATETYSKYEDELREVNRLRRELEGEPVTSISRPAQLDWKCEGRKPSLTAHKPTPAPAPSSVSVKSNPEPTQVVKDSQPETHPPKSENRSESAPIISGSTPEPKPDVQVVSQEKHEALPTPPTQIAKVFPDPQLQSLLDRFKRAYEQCDFVALQSLSDMTDRRLNNVKFMFSNYTAFSANIEHISQTPAGASAVLTLETGTRTTGETIPISGMSQHYDLRIPQHGDKWDKIMW